MMPKGNWKTNIASERKRWGRETKRSSFESCCCCRCVVYFLHLHNSLFGYWFIKWHRQQSNDGVCAVGADWGNIGTTTTTRAHTCRDGRPNYFLSVVVVLDIIEAWRIIFDRLATHTTIIVRFFFLLFFSILGLVSSNLSIPYREITDEMNIFWGSFVVSISTLSVRVTLNRMCIISHQFFNAKTFEIELQIAFCQFSEWKGKPWFLLFVQRS